VLEGQACTSALEKGEELVVEPSQASVLKLAKGSAAARRRVTGQRADVAEPQVMFVALTPETITLSWRGVPIADEETLWDLGLRDDDAVALEFESPVVPDQLRILRSPTPEKKAKGDKKKKG